MSIKNVVLKYAEVVVLFFGIVMILMIKFD